MEGRPVDSMFIREYQYRRDDNVAVLSAIKIDDCRQQLIKGNKYRLHGDTRGELAFCPLLCDTLAMVDKNKSIVARTVN